MLFRARRRKAPILAFRSEVVGRRSHAAAGREERALGPKVRAETVGGQGQIVIQPDGQAPLARVGLGGGELHGELPLHVAIKQKEPPMFFAKGLRFGRIRVLVGRGPVGPGPQIGIARVQVFVERAIGGEASSKSPSSARNRRTARRAPSPPGVRAETPRKPASGSAVSRRSPARTRHTAESRRAARSPRVSGCARGAAPPATSEIGDGFHIQVQIIRIENALRQIRAGVVRAAVVDGVQRIQGDEAGVRVVRDPVDDAVQIAQVAAAPNCARSARRRAPAPCPRLCRRRPAPDARRRGLGRHDEARNACRNPPSRMCTS
jgi:hypothetical protein